MAFVLGLLASCGAESAALAPTGAAGGSAAGAAGATSVTGGFGGVGPGDIDASPDAASGTGGSSGSEAGVATQVDGGDGGEAGRTCDEVRSDFLAVLASSGSVHCATTWECNAGGPADSAYHPWPSRPPHRPRRPNPAHHGGHGGVRGGTDSVLAKQSMEKWIFTGVVHPERAGLNINPLAMSGSDRPGALAIQAEFQVSNGYVTGQLTIDQQRDRGVVRMLARQLVQSAVDHIGFIEAAGYEVEVHTVVPADAPVGHPTLGFSVSEQASDQDQVRRRALLQNLPSHLSGDINLVAALANLRVAIRDPQHAAFFTYRVAETIRQHFKTPGNESASASWTAMHAALATTKEDLDALTPIATAVRHGESLDVTEEAAASHTALALRYIERFLEHLATTRPRG